MRYWICLLLKVCTLTYSLKYMCWMVSSDVWVVSLVIVQLTSFFLYVDIVRNPDTRYSIVVQLFLINQKLICQTSFFFQAVAAPLKWYQWKRTYDRQKFHNLRYAFTRYEAFCWSAFWNKRFSTNNFRRRRKKVIRMSHMLWLSLHI